MNDHDAIHPLLRPSYRNPALDASLIRERAFSAGLNFRLKRLERIIATKFDLPGHEEVIWDSETGAHVLDPHHKSLRACDCRPCLDRKELLELRQRVLTHLGHDLPDADPAIKGSRYLGPNTYLPSNATPGASDSDVNAFSPFRRAENVAAATRPYEERNRYLADISAEEEIENTWDDVHQGGHIAGTNDERKRIVEWLEGQLRVTKQGRIWQENPSLAVSVLYDVLRFVSD